LPRCVLKTMHGTFSARCRQAAGCRNETARGEELRRQQGATGSLPEQEVRARLRLSVDQRSSGTNRWTTRPLVALGVRRLGPKASRNAPKTAYNTVYGDRIASITCRCANAMPRTRRRTLRIVCRTTLRFAMRRLLSLF
jgi:hypothetical protein